MKQTVIPYRKHEGLTLSESIDVDHEALRATVEAGLFLAFARPDGSLFYMEAEGAPPELVLTALTIEELAALQAKAKHRALIQFN